MLFLEDESKKILGEIESILFKYNPTPLAVFPQEHLSHDLNIKGISDKLFLPSFISSNKPTIFLIIYLRKPLDSNFKYNIQVELLKEVSEIAPYN